MRHFLFVVPWKASTSLGDGRGGGTPQILLVMFLSVFYRCLIPKLAGCSAAAVSLAWGRHSQTPLVVLLRGGGAGCLWSWHKTTLCSQLSRFEHCSEVSCLGTGTDWHLGLPRQRKVTWEARLESTFQNCSEGGCSSPPFAMRQMERTAWESSLAAPTAWPSLPSSPQNLTHSPQIPTHPSGEYWGPYTNGEKVWATLPVLHGAPLVLRWVPARQSYITNSSW